LDIAIVVILGVLSGVGLLLAMILCIETLSAAFAPPMASAAGGERRRLAVLIPAHDEASALAATLRALARQLAPADWLLVVADNCSDATAAIAAAEGAEVIERHDSVRRGKGYALEFGLRHLERDAPEVMIVVDADCTVAPGAIDRLSRLCDLSGRPVQALYLMQAPEDAGPLARLAQFAWTVRNQVRPLGLRRLGLPCQLMGSGMAFPWKRIRPVDFATGHLVEDLKLGIDLARAGVPPLLCPEALVTSFFPASKEGTRRQRTRWEHGHLALMISAGPRLLLQGVAAMSVDLVAMGLDLWVPPLSLLALQICIVWLAAAALAVLTGVRFPVEVASAAAGLMIVAILASWARYGRHIVSLGTLVLAFAYALGKIPMYGRFVWARQLEWVRTERDARRHAARIKNSGG